MMKKLTTTTAKEVSKKLSQKTGEQIDIYYGTPDARFTNRYWAIATTWEGKKAAGTHGVVIAENTIFFKLLNEELYLRMNI